MGCWFETKVHYKGRIVKVATKCGNFQDARVIRGKPLDLHGDPETPERSEDLRCIWDILTRLNLTLCGCSIYAAEEKSMAWLLEQPASSHTNHDEE